VTRTARLSLPHVPATGRPRVYCPCCGEVRGSEQYTRAKQRPTVYAHYRRDVDGPETLCPGGPIDLTKDAAT
jgi:hypothetical protein